jgi:hypothetical protein
MYLSLDIIVILALNILAKCFVQIDVMSSLIERRDELTKIQTALKKFFLKSRKEHLINEIIILLRDKSFNEIDAFKTLFLFQCVNVLSLTLIVKKQIVLALKEILIKLNNLKRNTT